MALVPLRDDSKVNVVEIDCQHEKLISLLNQLHEAMELRKGTETLGELLSELVEYTQGHFAYEEQLMSQYEYPEYAKHQAEHEKLMQHITDLADRFRSGDLLLSFAIMLALRNWAMIHIDKRDKPLGAFLNGKNVF